MSTKKTKERKRRDRELKLKQAKLVNALPTSASVSEAGRTAGYFDAPTAHRALESIREKMPKVLERRGLTPDFAAQKCLSPMNAKETKFFANQGIVLETREVEALSKRSARAQFRSVMVRRSGSTGQLKSVAAWHGRNRWHSRS